MSARYRGVNQRWLGPRYAVIFFMEPNRSIEIILTSFFWLSTCRIDCSVQGRDRIRSTRYNMSTVMLIKLSTLILYKTSNLRGKGDDVSFSLGSPDAPCDGAIAPGSAATIPPSISQHMSCWKPTALFIPRNSVAETVQQRNIATANTQPGAPNDLILCILATSGNELFTSRMIREMY